MCNKRGKILNFHLDDSRQGGAEDFPCLFMRCESRSGNSIIRIPWPTPGFSTSGDCDFVTVATTILHDVVRPEEISVEPIFAGWREKNLISDLYNVLIS